MRALAPLLMLALAGPAAAQPPPYLPFVQGREAQAAAEAEAARYREVILANELAALRMRLQAEAAISNLQSAQRTGPAPVPGPVAGPRASDAAPASFDTSKLISIPDAVLAQSNARVLAAARNRR